MGKGDRRSSQKMRNRRAQSAKKARGRRVAAATKSSRGKATKKK